MRALGVVRAKRVAMAALTVALAAGLVGVSAVVWAAGAPPPSFAFVARADDAADALAVGPVAGQLGAPLFTTFPSSLDPNAKAGLQALDPDVVVIAGGTAAISTTVENQISAAVPGATVRRVAGAGRTETAKLIADLLGEYDPAFAATQTTQDGYAGCDALEMLPPNSAYTYERNYLFDGDKRQVRMAGTVLACGIDLPHGARVRALRVGIGDPVTDQMVICTLRRNDLRGPTDQVMARVETTIPGTTTGTDVFVDSSIDHAVVDAKNHTHGVVCTLGADTKVAGAVVRYQLVDVATTTP